MLFELVKNSLRAVNDRFESDDSGAEAPPVRLVVAEGDEDITLKVSDEGGGIPRSGLPRIWTYLYSTARSPLDDMEKEGEGDDGPAVLGELERERGEEEGEKKRARKARGGRKRRRRDSLFLKIKNTSKTKQNAQLATATASRSRGSTRDISVAICRLSRWRVRETVFSFFFFIFYFFLFPVRRGSWKVENSTQKINSRFFPIASLSPSTLKTIINRIWHGRLLAPQQAGERVGAAAVRQGGRERDVGRFLTSFCVFLVSLGSPTTPPPKILFSPSTFFFSSMRVARVLAPLLLCCPSVLRGHRAARASILSPPLNFSVFL